MVCLIMGFFKVCNKTSSHRVHVGISIVETEIFMSFWKGEIGCYKCGQSIDSLQLVQLDTFYLWPNKVYAAY
jgi:hypothetical protein